jgi:hypothetical protein
MLTEAKGVDDMQVWPQVLRALTVVAVLAVVSGCSLVIGGDDSAADTAVKIIEGQIADELAMGSLDARCDSPPTEDVGAEFTCTATVDGDDARVISFDAVIDEADHVNVQSANLLTRDDVTKLEVGAVGILNDQFALALPDDSIDCGSDPVILNPALEVDCAFTDPSNGDVYDTLITITDPVELVIEISVAETPR